MTFPNRRHAHVIGLGLIGASMALALKQAGWRVTGEDASDETLTLALSQGIVDAGEMSDAHTLVIIATPAGAVADTANRLLAHFEQADLVVSDVAGVKSAIVAEVTDERFLGGHPMAGSELRGLRGAREDLFQGCNWVLTPTDTTLPTIYSTLHGILREIGANVVAVSAEDHDRLVALASHVPHLLAGALMNEAAHAAQQDAVLLQLAAGGFRDMTRVAAGDPTIWPDILFENRDAVTTTLSSLESRLARLRVALLEENRTVIGESLRNASEARRQLPGRALSSENLAYLRVEISDQPGSLATVTRAASELLINIYDIEIAHGIEGVAGTLLLTVDALRAETLHDTLRELGFKVASEQ
ncbi:MAG: prephenate dehydrogenase/arogenate dehydrogenase family protein [Acidobacteria bacterium]|nr:prephenate dehydrogenase/arogenate dehydrogenase family protein [Acidobacteriota bacterium]